MGSRSVERPKAILRERIAGTSDAVQSHLRTLEGATRACELDTDRSADMLIVLGEILNNIVEHAFTGSDDGWIVCTIHRHKDRFSVETRDNGAPLPPGLLTAGPLPDIDTTLDDLPEGGFGWFIVHTLTDDMIYERRRGQNRLTFSLALP
ncbi:MAG: ATP-binding protein [Jannaschia sp.]